MPPECLPAMVTKSYWWDLNPRPRPYQGRALPAELQQHVQLSAVLNWPSVAQCQTKPSRIIFESGSYQPADLQPCRNFSKKLTRSRERAMGIEPTWPAWKAGTLPLSYARERASITQMGEAGFEPAKAEPPDLQSGPFDHSGIPPWSYAPPRPAGSLQGRVGTHHGNSCSSAGGHLSSASTVSRGASGGTRTHNPRFTKPELYH